MMQIIEGMGGQNAKPRAEIVGDIEILEVDRTRGKQYGLNLSEYGIGGIFSPETSPSGTTAATNPGTGGGAGGGTGGTGGGGTRTAASRTRTRPSGARHPPPLNPDTAPRGLTFADFYLAAPTAVVR